MFSLASRQNKIRRILLSVCRGILLVPLLSILLYHAGSERIGKDTPCQTRPKTESLMVLVG